MARACTCSRAAVMIGPNASLRSSVPRELRAGSFLIDGEAVCCDETGQPRSAARTDRGPQGRNGDSKRSSSRYESGRSALWLKTKNPDSPAVRRLAEEDWS